MVTNPYILGLISVVVIIAALHLIQKHLLHPWLSRPYPADHALATDRIWKYIDAIAADLQVPDDALVAQLTGGGVPAVDATLVIRFVPMAFAFAILRRMGVSSFPSYYFVFDKADRPTEMPLAREHYFSCALVIADHVANRGYTDRITRAVFEAILARSAEMDALHKVLAAGKEIAGSKVLPPTILDVSTEEIAASRK